jgi:hypothetical protein
MKKIDFLNKTLMFVCNNNVMRKAFSTKCIPHKKELKKIKKSLIIE